MLVLSRQRDETIMIGDSVEITIVDIRGDKVRVGIAAPSQVAVHRKEVFDSIRKENEHAAGLDESSWSRSLPHPELKSGEGSPPLVIPAPRVHPVRLSPRESA